MIQIEPPRSPDLVLPANLKSTLARFLRRAQTAVGLSGEVEVLLTSDVELRRLNRTFRGKNKPTDVLSFPALSFPKMPEFPELAGDLAISLETAARQAAEHGHPLLAELKILLLHGLLHLHGLDHETDSGEMRAREAELRASLRLPAGLIDRTLGKTDPSTPPRRTRLRTPTRVETGAL